MEWELRAGCKVNLYLDIVGVREDGYHEIESLFYPLPAPCDVLRLEEGGEGLRLSCSDPVLATPENILVRAYQKYASLTGFAPGLRLFLEKNIPMGAGLGGGSSDAASLLLWLNARAQSRGLAPEALSELALTLGADVPFFLQNRPAWVTGIGENLHFLDLDLGDLAVLLVCPALQANTKWAYRRWDAMSAQGCLPRRKGLTLQDGLIMKFCSSKQPALWNAFEHLVFMEFPILSGIKQEILDHAAAGCVMSGSGSTMVGLFASAEDAACCARRMRTQGHVCHGIRSGQPFDLGV